MTSTDTSTRESKFLKLNELPDYSTKISFSRDKEEAIEKEIEVSRKSYMVDWDAVNRMRFTI